MTLKAFPSLNAPPSAHMHTAFLERAAQPGNSQRAHALGCFLTLRAVDRMGGYLRPALIDGIAHQLRAAASYLEELHPQSKDVSHLRETVRVAQRSLRTNNRGLLWAPLLAFAYWLENELRLDESLDVLDTAFRLKDGTEIRDQIAGHLQQGRVLRIAGRFTEAQEAYLSGGNLARYAGDFRSEMVSRIGRANILQKVGDLPRAEAALKEVSAAATTEGDDFVRARAIHELAAVAFYSGQPAKAVPLAFSAYQLYDESTQRGRALNDMGVFLKELGHYSAAKEAFVAVLDSEVGERRAKTELELLELSAFVQDRVGFARWRKELESKYETLPPDDSVDFDIKLGIGLVIFGNKRDARLRFTKALATAEKYGFGQRIFEAERLISNLEKEDSASLEALSQHHEVVQFVPEVQEAVESLYALRAET